MLCCVDCCVVFCVIYPEIRPPGGGSGDRRSEIGDRRSGDLLMKLLYSSVQRALLSKNVVFVTEVFFSSEFQGPAF